MGKPKFYRVINLVVLPVAAFLGFNVLMSLPAALTNPALLLTAFVIACVPMYAFTSNYFYNKGIKKGEACKPSLKDWIKVNAYVSILFSVFMMIACLLMLSMLNDPAMIAKIKDQLPENVPAAITVEQVQKAIKFYCYFLLPFSVLLLVHIVISLRFIKRYRHLFGSSHDPQ